MKNWKRRYFEIKSDGTFVLKKFKLALKKFSLSLVARAGAGAGAVITEVSQSRGIQKDPLAVLELRCSSGSRRGRGSGSGDKITTILMYVSAPPRPISCHLNCIIIHII